MRSPFRGPVPKLALVLALLLSGSGLTASPASASPSYMAVGDISFDGTATLERFPCQPPAPFGNGPCRGLFLGSWSGSLTGMFEGDPFEIAWRSLDGDEVHAYFDYYEHTCAVPEAGTLLGFAQGNGYADAGTNEVAGVLHNTITGLPALITELRLEFSFDWTRVGNAAAINLTTVAIRANAGGRYITVVWTPQKGTADFIPRHSDAPNGIPNCTTPLEGVEGVITGDVSIAHNPEA